MYASRIKSINIQILIFEQKEFYFKLYLMKIKF